MSGNHGDAAYWHDHAEKARVLGALMSDPGARHTMFELAARWDEMADRAERAVVRTPGAGGAVAWPRRSMQR